MCSETRRIEIKKLKVIIIISFVLTLLFSSMDIAEYLNDRRIDRAENIVLKRELLQCWQIY